jgi:hypothetical protein
MATISSPRRYPMSLGISPSSDESLSCRCRDVDIHRRGASGGVVCEGGGGGDVDPHRHGLGDWETCLVSIWRMIEGVVVVVVVVVCCHAIVALSDTTETLAIPFPALLFISSFMKIERDIASIKVFPVDCRPLNFFCDMAII